jgi:hypothetical protein
VSLPRGDDPAVLEMAADRALATGEVFWVDDTTALVPDAAEGWLRRMGGPEVEAMFDKAWLLIRLGDPELRHAWVVCHDVELLRAWAP